MAKKEFSDLRNKEEQKCGLRPLLKCMIWEWELQPHMKWGILYLCTIHPSMTGTVEVVVGAPGVCRSG